MGSGWLLRAEVANASFFAPMHCRLKRMLEIIKSFVRRSDAAAQRLAMLYSLFGTCKALGVNPHRWLKRVLQLIPETKMSELGKLLPGKLKLD